MKNAFHGTQSKHRIHASRGYSDRSRKILEWFRLFDDDEQSINLVLPNVPATLDYDDDLRSSLNEFDVLSLLSNLHV